MVNSKILGVYVREKMLLYILPYVCLTSVFVCSRYYFGHHVKHLHELVYSGLISASVFYQIIPTYENADIVANISYSLMLYRFCAYNDYTTMSLLGSFTSNIALYMLDLDIYNVLLIFNMTGQFHIFRHMFRILHQSDIIETMTYKRLHTIVGMYGIIPVMFMSYIGVGMFNAESERGAMLMLIHTYYVLHGIYENVADYGYNRALARVGDTYIV